MGLFTKPRPALFPAPFGDIDSPISYVPTGRAHRQTRQRKDPAVKITALLAAVISAAISLAILTGLTMLVLGAGHDADHHIPALGFTATLALVVAARLALAGVDTSNNRKGTK